jgi:hypothetical protein
MAGFADMTLNLRNMAYGIPMGASPLTSSQYRVVFFLKTKETLGRTDTGQICSTLGKGANERKDI